MKDRVEKIKKALPSFRFINLVLLGSLLLGVAIEGLNEKALLGLLFGLIMIVMVTVRNYDPVSWEAYHDPRTFALRRQRDTTREQLRVLVAAVESNDKERIEHELINSKDVIRNFGSTAAPR